MPETLGAVLYDQPLKNRLAIGIAKKRVMLSLADVQADDQILGRTPNPLPEKNYGEKLWCHISIID